MTIRDINIFNVCRSVEGACGPKRRARGSREQTHRANRLFTSSYFSPRVKNNLREKKKKKNYFRRYYDFCVTVFEYFDEKKGVDRNFERKKERKKKKS